MKAPLKESEYPRYFIIEGAMYSFVSPTKMYMIHPRGSNKNEGLTIDYYITRRMVLLHWPAADREVTAERFRQLLEKLYGAMFNRVLNRI